VVVAHVVADHGWLVVRMLMTDTPEPRPPTLCWRALGVPELDLAVAGLAAQLPPALGELATPVAPIG